MWPYKEIQDKEEFDNFFENFKKNDYKPDHWNQEDPILFHNFHSSMENLFEENQDMTQ
jgi:hypothetical protein